MHMIQWPALLHALHFIIQEKEKHYYYFPLRHMRKSIANS